MTTHVFRTMGTAVSLIFGDGLPERAVLLAVESVFEEDDRRFSLYRRESEISRLARGEFSLSASSVELRAAYERAMKWRLLTHGAFTPERPDGVLDLSGIVKALSIDKARVLLERSGTSDAIIDVGGDAVVMGTDHGEPWVTGIVDPMNRSRLLCSVPLGGDRSAIATSGTAERGDHVWGAASSPYVQVTTLAWDIVTADVLATAILAGGEESRDDVVGRWPVDVLTVDRDGALEMTPRMRRKAIAMSTAR